MPGTRELLVVVDRNREVAQGTEGRAIGIRTTLHPDLQIGQCRLSVTVQDPVAVVSSVVSATNTVTPNCNAMFGRIREGTNQMLVDKITCLVRIVRVLIRHHCCAIHVVNRDT